MIRRNYSFALLTFSLLLLSSVSFAAGYAQATLGNGLNIIVVEDHSTDLVAIDIWVNAGSAKETKANNGVAHFIEHLLFAGSQKYKPGQVDIEAETLGAGLDAHTSNDWARFSTTVATRFFPKAMDLMAELVLHPTFEEGAVQREKLVILDELARKNSIIQKVADDALRIKVYGNHPYSLPIEGTSENIKKITRQQILDYYGSLYTADNMAVVVTGDIIGNDAVQIIGKLFQNMPKTSKAAAIPDFTYPKSGSEQTLSQPGKIGCLAIGFAGPSAVDYADVCAVDVLLGYMSYGYKNWLDVNLIDKTNLAVSASADFLTHKYPGLLSFTVTAKNDNLQECKQKILSKLTELGEKGLDETELSGAKRSLLGQFAFQKETFSGRGNVYGFYHFVSNTDFGDNYMERIQAVTNQDIINAVNKYMKTELANVVTINSKD